MRTDAVSVRAKLPLLLPLPDAPAERLWGGWGSGSGATVLSSAASGVASGVAPELSIDFKAEAAIFSSLLPAASSLLATIALSFLSSALILASGARRLCKRLWATMPLVVDFREEKLEEELFESCSFNFASALLWCCSRLDTIILSEMILNSLTRRYCAESKGGQAYLGRVERRAGILRPSRKEGMRCGASQRCGQAGCEGRGCVATAQVACTGRVELKAGGQSGLVRSAPG